jgi:hypothetical protein
MAWLFYIRLQPSLAVALVCVFLLANAEEERITNSAELSAAVKNNDTTLILVEGDQTSFCGIEALHMLYITLIVKEACAQFRRCCVSKSTSQKPSTSWADVL